MKPRWRAWSHACGHARRALDRHHDSGKPPGKRVRAHIDGCSSCGDYEGYLRGLGEELRRAVDGAFRDLGDPDMDALRLAAQEPGRRSARPIPRVWVAAAATALLIASVVPVYTRVQLRRSIQLGADLLAESVLGSSLLEGVEYSAARKTDVDAVLDDLGGSRRLFSPGRRVSTGVFN